jgi:hypothetical protein
MVVARTLQCGRLLPLLRPKPSLASHTQGGPAAGEKVAASRRIPNTAHRRSDGTSLKVGHYKIAGAGTCEDSQSKTTSSLLNHSEVPTDARPNVVRRIAAALHSCVRRFRRFSSRNETLDLPRFTADPKAIQDAASTVTIKRWRTICCKRAWESGA